MAQIPAKKVVIRGTKTLTSKVVPTVSKALPKKVVPSNVFKKNSIKNSKKSVTTKSALVKKPVVKRQKIGKIVVSKSSHSSLKSKVTISDNTKKSIQPAVPVTRKLQKSTKKTLTVRQSLFPAILSPFRFPVPSTKFLSNVARIAGVFFVATGSILALFNLSSIDVAQQATLIDGTSTTTSDPLLSPNYTSGSIDTKPAARISIESGTTFINTIPITITVALANEVKVIAIQKSTNQQFPLGSASNVDATTWSYRWDTLPFADGEYMLKLMIRNQYGSYEHTDSTVYDLKNHFETQTQANLVDNTIQPETTSTTDTATQSTSTSSLGTTQTNITASTTEVAPTIAVTLSILEDSPLRGSVAFKVGVAKASEVKISARNTKTYAIYYLGTATLHSEGEWRFEWDSKNVPDGNYAFQAKVFVNGVAAQSSYKSAAVDNIVETTTINTTDNQTIATTTATSEPVTTSELKPTIDLSLSKESPLSGFTDIRIKTSKVDYVELYVISKSSLTPRFLGLAQPVAVGEWKFVWDTKQSPNGDYSVYARVKTSYGFTEGLRTSIKILNEVLSSFTPEQEDSIDTFNTANNELIKTTSEPKIIEEIPKDSYPAPQVVYVQPVDSFVRTVDLDDSSKEDFSRLLNDFNSAMTQKMNALAVAIRNGDVATVERLKTDIENMKREVLLRIPEGDSKDTLLESVDTYLSKLIFELQELTAKNETLLKERLGEALVKDSDGDGISDYDEINLYHTNPFAADTDGDGYIDSVEIQLGYNPHDSSSEALVVYESPKETGIVREDILVISTITTLSSEKSSDGVSGPTKAIISGKGLPNSFVTLYIYSTPIVMTVKTDSDGSWSYIFDKELEDGDHEIYVGITDNAGRIVAKSNPLSFVKTAEAFTGGNTAVETDSPSAPLILKGNSMLLVGSIAVAALGLVLILLGIHATRKEDDVLVPQTV